MREVEHVEGLLVQVKNVLWNIFNRPTPSDIIDILIVAFLVYQLLMLTRETRASAVLKGLMMLLVASWASELLGLTALNWLLINIVNNGAVVLVILFQPELRKALEQIGRKTIRSYSRMASSGEMTNIVEQLTNAMMNLSKRRVGALIVIEQRIGLKDIIETGTSLDANISSGLLENIFEPNTPLHDGAVVIRGDRIMAAACFLTLSDDKDISRELGTRHRAGMGMAEMTDAITFIVSEETGVISVAREGKLTRYLDRKGIEKILSEKYQEKNTNHFTTLLDKLKRRRGDV